MTPRESTRSPWCLGRDQRPLGGPHYTHRMHAALGGATSCSQRLRVFVPHDFGLQTIRVAEKDAQGGAEVSNGAIRGSYVHETGARLLEGLPAPGIETKMVETAAPKHGGLGLCLGIARHLEDIERTLPTQRHNHHAFTDMASMVAIVVHHVRIKHLLVEANESFHVPRQEGDVVDPV